MEMVMAGSTLKSSKTCSNGSQRKATLLSEQGSNWIHDVSLIDGWIIGPNTVSKLTNISFNLSDSTRVGVVEKLTVPAAFTKQWTTRSALEGQTIQPMSYPTS